MSRIVLCCAASAALHKGADLASKLTQAGHEVRVCLTSHAARLISPQHFEALTGQPAYADEFAASRKSAMDHIELSEWAEALVCAPASAGLIGQLAHGLANDLPATVVLATPHERPRIVCPAMNPHMIANPAVERNLIRLSEDGWRIVEPGEGHMACGVHGRGRLAEPQEIVEVVNEVCAS
ncbi:MAG: flavoprotein [Planctomycetota bacterium]|jgi:phosphopantothenoylcysteine decarboxylase/phosphopantothenate--cysteine ligase